MLNSIKIDVTAQTVAASFNFSLPPKRKHKVSSNGNFYAQYLWLDTSELDQSDKIRSGIIIHQYIKWLVENSPAKAEVIRDDMVKVSSSQKREADLLFKLNNKIYYREIKGNVNLDSEKGPANLAKIADVANGLHVRYPDSEVDSGFLCPAWLNSENDVEGFNDFISILGYPVLSIEEFAALGKSLGKRLKGYFKHE
jgi:hypothetical protein